ncbi:MarR family winged helix-turn-helix transcriptional regulator [Cellulomonas sp. NPDC058312]|uniref:MarR family winged helix-turn-helix transcriptional regulator n=1 Tax=Cellulomonas sp. NPDC058312 TaxID=3346441 RepID=UPI0036EA41FA
MSDPDSADIAYLVAQLHAATTEHMRPLLDELGLTGACANLLWLADGDREPQPLRQLAGQLGCDPSNVTLIAGRLEETGLARRVPAADDRRVRTLELTEEGQAARAALLDRAATLPGVQALAPAERAQLAALLARATTP